MSAAALEDLPARGRVKGLPPSINVPGPGSLSSHEWNLAAGDVPLPVLALNGSAVDNNIHAMAAWCHEQGVALAPHGKTTMVPELFRRQLAAGAWAITVSSPRQAEAAVAAGADRIVIAHQVVDPIELDRLVAIADEGHEVYVFVDSIEGIRRLNEASGRTGHRLRAFVEIGFPGGRTGVRDGEAFRDLLTAVDRSPNVDLAGVTAFEGIIPAVRRPLPPPLDGFKPDLTPVRRYLTDVSEMIQQALDTGHLAEKPIVTAGGSGWFDLVVEHLEPVASLLVLRSGCYLTHDDGLYTFQSPLEADEGVQPDAGHLRAALHLWAHVVSRPEYGVAIVGFGRRDAGDDIGMPVPLQLVKSDGKRIPIAGWSTNAMWDQHARLVANESESSTSLRTGDVVAFGVSHPCTTIDRWRSIVETDDDDNVLAAWETWF